MPRKKIVTIAEFSIHPIGSGTSVGRYVSAAVRSISGIRGQHFEVTPMATVMESSDISTILKAVAVSHATLRRMGCKRISSILRVDERLDKRRSMRDKVEKVLG